MSDENPFDNVVHLRPGATNPAMIEQLRRNEVSLGKQEMLDQIDLIRAAIERDEIEGVALIARGAPGHLDISWLSAGLYDAPAVTVGLMEMQSFEFKLMAFQHIEAAPLE